MEHKGEFFDSYGNNPGYYDISFTNYLKKHAYEWDFNKRKLQSVWSDVCGQYCIFYLHHRAQGQSMSKIVKVFENDTMSNDNKVFNFVNRHFNFLPKGLSKQHG